MLIFIHTTLRARKSQRTEVWKCANYSANKCKCDSNRTPQQLYAPSHTILSNWRCLSEFAAHNKAKQTSERERESKEHRMFVRPFVVGGFRRRAAAENMWAVAESCFASVIPKRLTHTNTESLSLARTLSRHFALYFSLLVLVFMPSPHQEKTCSRRIECLARRIECHAFCGVLRRQFGCDRYNVKFSVRNSLYVIVVVIAVSFVFVFDAFNCCYCAHPTSS